MFDKMVIFLVYNVIGFLWLQATENKKNGILLDFIIEFLFSVTNMVFDLFLLLAVLGWAGGTL